MLTGFATPEKTAAYAARNSHLAYRPLSDTGLQVSQAGFGSYRVDVRSETHREALQRALRNGINLIDTSSNYADGRSEELIGSLLGDLSAAGEIERAHVVVVSKVGYLQGQNYELSQQRKAAGEPFPDLVAYGPGLEHCIHPDFIADQLGRSLARLQLETLDGYLLHNPEYYLGWAKKNEVPLADARAEYYRRIELAFRHLEQEVAGGRIRCYGVSSNSFPKPESAVDFTSLERVWEIAERIDPKHHFRVVQLPMNLLETEAASVRNQSTGQTVLQYAREKNLAVLVNRPLNAVVGSSLVRLATLPPISGSPEEPDAADVETRIEALVAEEERLKQAVFDIDIPFRTKQEFAATLAAGQLLKQRWQSFFTLSNWNDVREGYLVPRAQTALQFLGRRPELPADVQQWCDAYSGAFTRALQAVTAFYRAQAKETHATILANVATAEPQWRTGEVSHTAIRAVRSTQGVTCVLVGMRRPAYVDDVLAELQEEIPQRDRTAAWELLGQAVKQSGGG